MSIQCVWQEWEQIIFFNYKNCHNCAVDIKYKDNYNELKERWKAISEAAVKGKAVSQNYKIGEDYEEIIDANDMMLYDTIFDHVTDPIVHSFFPDKYI